MQLTPSKNAVLSDTKNGSYSMVSCTTAGSIIYNTAGGDEFTLQAVAGSWYPIGNAVNIRLDSTALGIVVT